MSYKNEQGHGVVLHPMMKSRRSLTGVNPSLLEILFRSDAPPRPSESIKTWSDILLVVQIERAISGFGDRSWCGVSE